MIFLSVRLLRIRGSADRGLHDLVKRSTKILEDYEEKLHLVEKFVTIREKIHEIHRLTKSYEGSDLHQVMKKIEDLSHRHCWRSYRSMAFESLTEKLQNVFKNLRSKRSFDRS